MATKEGKCGVESNGVISPDTFLDNISQGSIGLNNHTEEKIEDKNSDESGSDSSDINRNIKKASVESGKVEDEKDTNKNEGNTDTQSAENQREVDKIFEVGQDDPEMMTGQSGTESDVDSRLDDAAAVVQGSDDTTTNIFTTSTPVPEATHFENAVDTHFNDEVKVTEDDISMSPLSIHTDKENSMFSEDGYVAVQSLQSSEQSPEKETKGEVENESGNMKGVDLCKDDEDKDDNDDEEETAKRDSSSCTDTSQLAQVIVEHVLENAVASFNDDVSSIGSGQDIQSIEVSQDTMNNNRDFFPDLVRLEEPSGNQESVQVGVISHETEEKEYATNQALTPTEIDGIEIRSPTNETTDFQLANENDKESGMGDNSAVINQVNEMEAVRKMDEEEEIDEVNPKDDYLSEESVAKSEAEHELAGHIDSQDTQSNTPDFFENYGSYKTPPSGEEGISKDEKGQHELDSRKAPVGGISKIVDQGSDIGANASEEKQRLNGFLHHGSSAAGSGSLEVTDRRQMHGLPERSEVSSSPPSQMSSSSVSTIQSSPPSSSQITTIPNAQGGVIYTLVASSNQNSSQPPAGNANGMEHRHREVATPDLSFEDGGVYDRGRIVNDRPPQTPPQMVLRTKKEHLSSESYLQRDVDSEERNRRVSKDDDREQEAMREQMILEKVRKDMAAKEREMRERLEREMIQRQMELDNSREFYRTENDLSEGASRIPYSSVYQPSLARSEHSQVPKSPQMSTNVSRIYSDIQDLSDSSILNRYQHELARKEQQHDVGGDTYATLQRESHASPEMPSKDELLKFKQKIDSLSQNDVTRKDQALLSEIYSRYNIPPPQYNVSTSFDTDPSSSRILSDLEAPPPKSGSIPPFKTLQEQQVGWMRMFQTLEEQHQAELKNQYRKHQEVIFQMQQHMDSELFSQQQLLKKKLAAHKQVLSHGESPGRNSSSMLMDHSDLANNTSHMTYPNLESTRFSSDGRVLSSDTSYGVDSSHSSRQTRRSPARNRMQSPQWRDIYREIRGKNVDSDGTTEDTDEGRTTPVNRSLDEEFASEMIESHIRSLQKSPRSPRTQSRTHSTLSQPEMSNTTLPRAGVYSSPMPILRRGNNSQYSLPEASVSTDRKSTSPSLSRPVCKEGPSTSSEILQREIESRHQRTIQHEIDQDDITGTETSSDEMCLSSSTRVNLREKHAKHLSDLREYYEEELRELRTALSQSDDITNRSPFKHVANENRALISENKNLKERSKNLENEIDKSNKRIQELEQKVYGLEKRASDYADHYKEAQDKISTFRHKMEELQYSTRSQDDTIQQLEGKIRNQTDAISHYKKVQEEQHKVIQSDRIAYHKLADKYEALDRENGVLKESLNATENKLYDSRTETVELNRTVAKLELENKRIGRENDNLHHKVTQSMNSASFQHSFNESFGTPTRESVPATKQREPSVDRKETRQDIDRSESKMKYQSSAESKLPDVVNGDAADHSSPVMRAERELWRLREIMRQAESSTSSEPSQPIKVKKKYYGSEAVSKSRGSEYTQTDSATPRVKKPADSAISGRQKSSSRSEESVNSCANSPTKQPHKSRFEVNPDDFRSPTRFDVSVQNKKSRTSTQENRPKGSSSSRQKSSSDNRNAVPKTKTSMPSSSETNDPRKSRKRETDASKKNSNSVENTLDRIHSGDFVARPEWEDIYTSLANSKPSSSNQPQPSTKRLTVEQRMQNVTDLEKRYDNLNTEKKKLEALLSRVPMHGKGRQEKEHLEDKLDGVEKELGSVRMSLKRYHVLKTTI